MGFFSKLRDSLGRFSRREDATEESIVAQLEDEIEDIRSEGLGDLWDDSLIDNMDDVATAHEFAIEQNGAELFRIGWMEFEGDPDTTQAARDEFFDLMEAYDISRDEFDWDAWRDWYEGE